MTNVQVEAADFETATAAVKNMGLGWNLGNTLEANRQSVTTDVTSPDYWGQQGLVGNLLGTVCYPPRATQNDEGCRFWRYPCSCYLV